MKGRGFRHFSLFMTLMFLTSLIEPAFAQAVANHLESREFEDSDTQIILDEASTFFRYGEYGEAEILIKRQVNSNYDLEFIGEQTPVGLNISQLDKKSALIHGTPEFVDKFCFLVGLRPRGDTEYEAIDRLCVFSELSQANNIPNFKSDRFLDAVTEKNYFSKNIVAEKVSNLSNVEMLFVQGELPEGVDVDSQFQSVRVSGTSQIAGSFEFVLLLTGLDNRLNETIYVFKQFQLDIYEATQIGSYQCAIGYYYDQNLGYCVQVQGEGCRVGEFYDFETGYCRAYPTSTHYSCAPGFVYDHFLFRCVPAYAQRCPYNYEFDPYYNRCVRLPQSCSIGFRYSYTHRACIYVGMYSCQPGMHFDAYLQRCVSNYQFCRAGYSWNGYNCVYRQRVCRGGMTYDPYGARCVGAGAYRACHPGTFYDARLGRCTNRVYVNTTCRPGTRWSPAHGGCVGHMPPPNRPVVVNRPVQPRPPHRPAPGPVPPHRPGPNRPAPGPSRPTPAPGPSRPTPAPGPSRPTPAPGPSRPTPAPGPSRPTPAPGPSRPTPAPGPSRPTPAPAPSRPTPAPAPSRPTPAPAPSRPTPAPAPSRPTPAPAPSRPAPAPSRPAPAPSRPAPAPSRPAPAPSRPTIPAPSRPSPAPSRPAPAPSRPSPSPSRPGPGRG